MLSKDIKAAFVVTLGLGATVTICANFGLRAWNLPPGEVTPAITATEVWGIALFCETLYGLETNELVVPGHAVLTHEMPQNWTGPWTGQPIQVRRNEELVCDGVVTTKHGPQSITDAVRDGKIEVFMQVTWGDDWVCRPMQEGRLLCGPP